MKEAVPLLKISIDQNSIAVLLEFRDDVFVEKFEQCGLLAVLSTRFIILTLVALLRWQ